MDNRKEEANPLDSIIVEAYFRDIFEPKAQNVPFFPSKRTCRYKRIKNFSRGPRERVVIDKFEDYDEIDEDDDSVCYDLSSEPDDDVDSNRVAVEDNNNSPVVAEGNKNKNSPLVAEGNKNNNNNRQLGVDKF